MQIVLITTLCIFNIISLQCHTSIDTGLSPPPHPPTQLCTATFHGKGALTAVAPEDDVTIPVLTPPMPSSAAHLPT